MYVSYTPRDLGVATIYYVVTIKVYMTYTPSESSNPHQIILSVSTTFNDDKFKASEFPIYEEFSERALSAVLKH